MGGGGPGTTTNPNTGLVSSAPVLQGTSPMDTFAGSRASLVNSAQDTINNQGLTGILQANPAYADAWGQYTNALAMNPTAPPVNAETATAPVGFHSSPFIDSSTDPVSMDGVTQSIDAAGIPHRGATDPSIALAEQQAEADAAAKAAADAAAAAKSQDPNRPGFYNGTELGIKIWPPEDPNQEIHAWLAANPNEKLSIEVPDKGPIGTPGNSWYLPKGVPR